MKRIKPWVAGVGLCLAVGSASALEVMLDFEGLVNTSSGLGFATIGTYNGASFSGQAVANQALFINSPTPFSSATTRTALSSGGEANPDTTTPPPFVAPATVMNYGAGIDLASLVFEYSSNQAQVLTWVQAWSGANGTGTLLGQVTILNNVMGCSNLAAPLCVWTPVDWDQQATGVVAGDARSLVFTNDSSAALQTMTLYDNIQFNSAAAIPEPSTYALMALGLAGIAMISRRRREV